MPLHYILAFVEGHDDRSGRIAVETGLLSSRSLTFHRDGLFEEELSV
jgi:hypothetical protein